MNFNVWFVIVGILLVSMAMSATVVKRLPLTTAMLYLGVGFILGPVGFSVIRINPIEQAGLLERITEIAILISLFTAGLKLRTPFTEKRWYLPMRLAFVSMAITVGLITLVGVYGLGLSWGAAVLFGAILAPTDPVLASDVAVEDPFDRDRLRFGLTGEAGLNDGSAFPFVMLGLGLMGLHELGPWGARWFLVDVLWAAPVGLGIGWFLGLGVGKLVLYLRREHKEAVGLDDFLALGLIALAYGVALLFYSYGFLAVFTAGLALRRIEMESTGEKAPAEVIAAAAQGAPEEVATDAEKAPAYMTQAVLGFNEQLERIGEVAVVVILGAMLSSYYPPPVETYWLIPVLFLVVRPLSVWLGLLGSKTSGLQQGLMGWFGIRGLGSIYYLMYAVEHGLAPGLANWMISMTLTVVAVSIVVHGISVTPLMNSYGKITRNHRVVAIGTRIKGGIFRKAKQKV
ncbi:sodium:proton antiporter [Candidatus Cyanaurora vandensis]|uniref:cation:proton antiporter n=1 Tax=Candidatus Cyanaurora vandensis TaxID=2714958 RepID=UPI00257D60B5|nr:sodium:proton antiporter [Candidatus Cyanaurora vandensis]